MLRARAVVLAAAMTGCSTEATAPTRTTPEPTPIARPPATSGPSTVPQSSFTGDTAACGDVFAYRASADGTQIFGVTLTKASRPGPGGVIDLGEEPSGVLVTVDVFAEPAVGLGCEQLASADGPKTTWVAEAGRLATVASDRDVSFVLEDVHLVGPEKGFAVVVPRVVIGTSR